jgi:hypothetical protein
MLLMLLYQRQSESWQLPVRNAYRSKQRQQQQKRQQHPS